MGARLAVDRSLLRAAFDREAVGRCRLAAIGLGLWALLALFVDARFAPGAYGTVAPLHPVLIAACLAVSVALRRGALAARHASMVGFLLWAVQVSLMWIDFASSREPVYLLCILLGLIASACLHLYSRWVLASIAVVFAGWAAVLSIAPESGTYTLAFVGAAMISCTIHIVQRRFLVGIERYRQQHSAIERALERALDETRRGLAERIAAEQARERLAEQLVHSQRLEALGTLAGGVAHDMNNVLTAIVGLAEFARDSAGAAAQADLAHIIDAARRGASLTGNLLAFGRRGRYSKETIDPAEVLRGTLALLSRTLPRGVAIESRLEHGLTTIDADGAQLGQALINLAINASDAMDGRGQLLIATEVVELDDARAAALEVAPGGFVALSVADTGAGMDPEAQRRAFEPFFTTKPQGKGTGLGLPMVYGTVRAHGGAVAVESAVGVGTTFTLYLPVRAASARSATSPISPAPLRGAGAVLVVDDDDDVRDVMTRRLRDAGFEVQEARDGREGMAAFASRQSEIRLVVLDMSMPVMGGAECFRALRELEPGVRVLLASGYTAEEDARACLASGALGLLPKPFTTAQLTIAVACALRGEKVDGLGPHALA